MPPGENVPPGSYLREDAPPDLAILVVAANRAMADALGDAVSDAGGQDMRTPYGFVIRCLNGNPLTLTELAERLEVTKPAAIKVVDEMQRRGYLTREASTVDRRRKLLQLTEKAQMVRRTALKTSHNIEADLRAELGEADVDAARRVLTRFIERHGGTQDLEAHRARPVW
jgi:DNA-binding MarR family transcriptional regulator